MKISFRIDTRFRYFVILFVVVIIIIVVVVVVDVAVVVVVVLIYPSHLQVSLIFPEILAMLLCRIQGSRAPRL